MGNDFKKPLSDMSLEELWRLFPIVLSEPRDVWQKWYDEESARLCAQLSEPELRLWHIGSTAMQGIRAKPIIDILLEIPRSRSIEDFARRIAESGYICMSREKERASFNRGYTENGFAERVFHLHLRYIGDNDELYFRDYMRQMPELAREYERLKLALWKKYEYDRDAYTQAKSTFIKKHTEDAKRIMIGKY